MLEIITQKSKQCNLYFNWFDEIETKNKFKSHNGWTSLYSKYLSLIDISLGWTHHNTGQLK